jgi:hypothetical protein
MDSAQSPSLSLFPEVHLFFFFFGGGGGTGILIQGLALSRQVLYPLSHAPTPVTIVIVFAIVIFQIQSCVFAWRWPQTVIFLPMPTT